MTESGNVPFDRKFRTGVRLVLRSVSFFLLLCFATNCISLRVYVPRTYKDPHEVPLQWKKYTELYDGFLRSSYSPGEIEVEFPEEQSRRFAKRNPTWLVFAPNYLENGYGSFSSLLKKEFAEHPEEYKGAYKVVVRRFDLETRDSWLVRPFTNEVSVLFEADVFAIGKEEPVWKFHFQDRIVSGVTDGMFVLATVTLVGWIFYLPYLGFRGNREDQLNQLGRIALLEFFEGWKRHPILSAGLRAPAQEIGK
ncbi:hypothetical protein EHO60_02825 [Leptospira fletcheri]|uniref:Uncharacterized protein n=1 Tax=Leptospira fletcheri TaxID=2484981 RepID=A0A4V3JE16_9LEPT|nr:hypothetical protein [Leptospira fletcheri]TGK13150.1 hypothetical protein EHO60_02825 [Leptospira fletcheri]